MLISMPSTLVPLAFVLLMASGCASHTIYAKSPDGTAIAGQSYRKNQVSIFGDKGLNSNGTGLVAQECREGDLTEVSVKRNVGQTLVTLFTLGMITPATIHFKCEKVGAPPPSPSDTDRPF